MNYSGLVATSLVARQACSLECSPFWAARDAGAGARQSSIVVPTHLARQGRPRQVSAPLPTAASVAALSRHYSWRDQTGYTV